MFCAWKAPKPASPCGRVFATWCDQTGSGVSEPVNHLLTPGEDASPNSGWQAGLKQTPPAEAHCSYCCYKVNERKLPQAKPATSACRLCVCACLPGGVRKTFNDLMIQAATQRENAVKSGGWGLLTSLGGAEGGAKRLKSWMFYKNWVLDWKYGGRQFSSSGHVRYCSKKNPIGQKCLIPK